MCSVTSRFALLGRGGGLGQLCGWRRGALMAMGDVDLTRKADAFAARGHPDAWTPGDRERRKIFCDFDRKFCDWLPALTPSRHAYAALWQVEPRTYWTRLRPGMWPSITCV